MTNHFSRLSSLLFPGILTLAVALCAFHGSLPGGHAAAQDLGRLNRFLQSSGASDTAMKAFRDGRDLIAGENWDRAAARFRGFISEHPKHQNVDAARYWLAFALKKQGRHAEAEQEITRLLRDYPRSDWRDDAEALRLEIAGLTGNQAAIQQQLDKDDQEMKMIALQSLFRADPDRALAIVGDMLKADSKASPRLRETALGMLSMTHSGKALPLLLEIARNNGDPKIRRAAIFGLGRSQDENALKLLEELAQKPGDDETAKSALFALTQNDSARAREFILNIARNGQSVELRKNAIFWLGQRGREGAIDELLKLYDSEQNPELKKQILFGFSQSTNERARTKLLDIARSDSNADTRGQAIFWLGQRGDEQTINTLIQIYDGEKNNEIKDNLIHGFGQSRQKAALRKLMQIARSDSSIAMRKRALFWLGQKKDPEITKFLEEMLK
ncbi:MAG: HEAT repeat domain-containing protein [Blastocatellia bacterium]